MPILQISQLPSNLQISQSTGIIIAIGLAVLIIIVAVALVIRARRRTASTREERISGIEKAPNTETYEEIAVSEGYRETTAIPLTEESHQDLTYSQTSEVAHTAEEEPKDVVPPELPHDTTTIVKGNVYVGAVIASSSQAAEIRGELNALSFSEAITPIESVIDEQSLKTKIREVRDDLDSNETLSVILLKCIDIAKSLYRRAELKWIQRELFGTVEWNDAVYLDVSNEEVFPAYRLINGTMYVNYTRYGDSFPTVEEYDIPVFENRSVYALEKILEEANIHNQDYVVLNVPAPDQWPRTASLGELISLTVATRDYLDLLAAVRKQVYDFMQSLDTSSS